MVRSKWIQIRVSEEEKALIDELRSRVIRKLEYTELFWLAIDLLRLEIGDKKNVNPLELQRQKAIIARVDMEKIEQLFEMLAEGIEKNRLELYSLKQELGIDKDFKKEQNSFSNQ